MSLTTASYIVDPGRIVGCPLITYSPATNYSVNDSTTVSVFSCSGSDLSAVPYEYNTKYPLLLKLFFTGVDMTGTITDAPIQFDVQVTGPFETVHCNRSDEKDFSLTHYIKNWADISMNVQVSVMPMASLTGVSFSCFAGIAKEAYNETF